MFNSASKSNRVVTSALSITYEVERRYETVGDVPVYWYKVTRRAAKDYRFVDMSEKAVIKAAAAKIEMYTRTTKKCITRTLDKTCKTLTSTVQPEYNDCGSWDLVIKVHEEDSTHSATLPSDPASLFTTENQRNYDELDNGIEALWIDTSWFSFETIGMTAEYVTANCCFKYLPDGTSTWTTIPNSDLTFNSPGGTEARYSWSGNIVSSSMQAGDSVKVVIGDIESNVVICQNPV